MTIRLSLALALVATFALVGCAGKSGTATKVTGKVTLPDGSPLPGGRIDFRSASGNMTSGVIKADGTYEAPTVPFGDHKVSVVNNHLKGIQPPPAGVAPMPGSDQKYVQINARYATPEQSGLSTTVNSASHTYEVQLKP